MQWCYELFTLYRRKYFHFFAPAKRTNNKLRVHPSLSPQTPIIIDIISIISIVDFYVHCRHHLFRIWVSKFVPQYLGWYYFLIWVGVPDRHMRFIFFTLVHFVFAILCSVMVLGNLFFLLTYERCTM